MAKCYGSIRIMSVDNDVRSIGRTLRSKLIEWIPLVCVFPAQAFALRREGSPYRHFSAGGWVTTNEADLPAHTPFSHTVLLVEDRHCSFQRRDFPTELISADALDEAIELDFEQWVPFSCTGQDKVNINWFACSERHGDAWHVAVWVWPERVSEQLLSTLHTQLSCTHLMPETAWHVALARVSEPTLLIVAVGDSQAFIMLDRHGLPVNLSYPASADEASRFWRSQGIAGNGAGTALCFDPDVEPVWLPSDYQLQYTEPGLPRYSILSRARRPGVRDWSDPLSWKKSLAAMAVLVVVWMASYAVMLNLRSSTVDDLAEQTQGQVQDVLQARENIERMQGKLNIIHNLQLRQTMPLKQLAALAAVLPEDIWIEMFRMKGEWVDLRGRGHDVSRLLVLLENIEGVTNVELLNDIRPDIKTGLEQFQLRLFFVMPDATSGDGLSDVASDKGNSGV